VLFKKPGISFEWEDYLISRGLTPVAGIDEAGRGPLAGPVVAAAAIILDRESIIKSGINDSKQLDRERREELFEWLINSEVLIWGAGAASVREIEKFNILNATFIAMKRAINNLPLKPGAVLIDGNRKIPDLTIFQATVVKGDSKSYSIAAASIIAKVLRDRLMRKLANFYPQYGWERNVGYPTKDHKRMIKKIGITPHHRKSFIHE